VVFLDNKLQDFLFCKSLLQNKDFRSESGKRRLRGMREKLPQAYIEYVEDNFLSITQSLDEKIILKEARKHGNQSPGTRRNGLPAQKTQ
jgi:hypothetical protein